jgi:hypothetical protein
VKGLHGGSTRSHAVQRGLEKAAIIGLYLKPPAHAAVFCVTRRAPSKRWIHRMLLDYFCGSAHNRQIRRIQNRVKPTARLMPLPEPFARASKRTLRNAFPFRCTIADFEPYSGQQQQNWPTSPGTFVSNEYIVPTYFGYPPRPYNVMGYLDARTAPIRHRGVVVFAARRAKELGADATIVLSLDPICGAHQHRQRTHFWPVLWEWLQRDDDRTSFSGLWSARRRSSWLGGVRLF